MRLVSLDPPGVGTSSSIWATVRRYDGSAMAASYQATAMLAVHDRGRVDAAVHDITARNLIDHHHHHLGKITNLELMGEPGRRRRSPL